MRLLKTPAQIDVYRVLQPPYKRVICGAPVACPSRVNRWQNATTESAQAPWLSGF